MDASKVFEAIEELESEYIKVWADICNIESPTSLKSGVDAVGSYIVGLCKRSGWECTASRQEVSGDAVCITMKPEAKKAPVCLSGHMDTVHPVGLFGSPAVRIDRENGKIYGPGVVDCKGGIASSLLCMAALQRCGYDERPVKLILQSDEEVSSITSGKSTVKFMAECAKGCEAFLNCEGHNRGKLTTERKGIIRYVLNITGKAAHSSKCFDGASAVLEAAHKIIQLEKWKDKDGITCNCGFVNGGSAPNTVPASCTVVADIRYSTAEQLEEVKSCVERIAETSYVDGTSCSLSIKSQRVSMEKNAVNEALFEKVARIFEENGLNKVIPSKSTGGSDASDMTAFGIPTVDNLGTAGGAIHSRDEWAWIDSLAYSAKMLAAIIVNI